MPRLYFIVRLEADNETRSSWRTKDITMTGLPMALEADTMRSVETHTVIDDDTTSTAWTYLVAFEMIKMEGKDIHVAYRTASRDDALQRFKKISQSVIEGDEERIKDDNLWNTDIEDDEDEDEDERHKRNTNDKAEIPFRGEAYIKIKLRQDSYLRYELTSVDVEDRANRKVTNRMLTKEETERGESWKWQRPSARKTWTYLMMKKRRYKYRKVVLRNYLSEDVVHPDWTQP
jgi:hypothetical protein